jgi:hypothetical protein
MPLTKATQNVIEGIVSTGSTGVSAGSFQVGQQYKITSLGTTIDTQWNTIAGTTGQTYVVGSLFTAATDGSGSGTGAAAVARTLANRFADVVNVLDFGADPTGSANSTSAINLALIAAGTTKTIWFPDGTYLISSNLTIPCKVIMDGVFLGTSSLILNITGDELRIEDYLKFYCGSNWNNFNAASATSQTKAFQEIVNSFMKRVEYTTLNLNGRKLKINSTVQVNFNLALESILPYTVGIYRLKTICDGQLWSDGVTNGDPLIRLYDSAAGRIQGVEFNNINMVCRFESSGILLSGWNSWNRISGCHIQYPRYFGIKQDSQDGSGLRIEQCIIAGREYDVIDADRESVGIWLETNDVYVSDTDVSYFKKCIYSNNGNNFFVNCHFWNDATHNNSPIIEIPPSVSRCVIDGCYLDNGPVWIGRGLEGTGSNSALGYVTITDCLVVKNRKGTADFLSIYPNQSGTIVVGIIIQNCQFNNGASTVINSIIRSGSTVTVSVTDHRNIVGDYINISGAVPSDYNGIWTITNIVNANSFEFDIGALTPLNASVSGTLETFGKIGKVNTTNGSISTTRSTTDCFVDNNVFSRYTPQGTQAIQRIDVNSTSTSYPIDWTRSVPFDGKIGYVNAIGVRSDVSTPVSVWYDRTGNTTGILRLSPAFNGNIIVQNNVNDQDNIEA